MKKATKVTTEIIVGVLSNFSVVGFGLALFEKRWSCLWLAIFAVIVAIVIARRANHD